MSPKLLAIAGPLHGASYAIADERFTIGRDPNNHVSVPDRSVSREHCVIVKQGDGFLLRDLGSHNGTLVNELRGTDQLLAHRDTITIGQTAFQFLTRDDIVFEDPAG